MSDIVLLNVGGGIFATRKSTLDAFPFFSSQLQSQSDASEVFVDRDPLHFRHILNWMRGVQHVPDDDSILQELIWECDYFCMHDMRDFIQRKKSRTNLNKTIQEFTNEVRENIRVQMLLLKKQKEHHTSSRDGRWADSS